jgi:hypothetical protein
VLQKDTYDLQGLGPTEHGYKSAIEEVSLDRYSSIDLLDREQRLGILRINKVFKNSGSSCRDATGILPRGSKTSKSRKDSKSLLSDA